MSKRNAELLISDILISAGKILEYTGGYTLDSFAADSKTFDAVIRNFEIIGEAANRLPADFQDKHTQIDWHRIRGFRNRIVHDYMGIDMNIVWIIIQDYLPTLIVQLNSIEKR